MPYRDPEVARQKSAERMRKMRARLAGTKATSDSVPVRALREAAAKAELPPLSLTAQQKLEAWQRKLEADFDHRVRLASQKWLDEVRIPLYEKQIDELEHMLNWPRNAVMTRAEYNTVLK